MLMISKEEFVDYMEFIEAKNLQQNALGDALEAMCPSCRCDTLVYADYEDKLVSLIERVMGGSDLISYRLYDYSLLSDAQKAEQLKESPELETWRTLYDYLAENAEADQNA